MGAKGREGKLDLARKGNKEMIGRGWKGKGREGKSGRSEEGKEREHGHIIEFEAS